MNDSIFLLGYDMGNLFTQVIFYLQNGRDYIDHPVHVHLGALQRCRSEVKQQVAAPVVRGDNPQLGEEIHQNVPVQCAGDDPDDDFVLFIYVVSNIHGRLMKTGAWQADTAIFQVGNCREISAS